MENVRNAFLEIRNSTISLEWFHDIFYPVPHMHKDIELLYCKEGCLQCFISSEAYEICAGDVFVVFPNQIHNYVNRQPGEYGVLIFPPGIVHNLENFFFDNIPESNVIHPENQELFDSIMSQITSADGIYKETVQVGLINQLTPLYLSNVEIQSRQKTDFSSVNMQKILNYCSQNFTEDISLVSVAQHFHFSKFYISHLFNEKLKVGFKRYINCLRVNKAMDLMKKGEKSMTRIAEKAGFGSIRSFNRVFLQIATVTPYDYYKHLMETGEFIEINVKKT